LDEDPRYLGAVGYDVTAIQHFHPSQASWVEMSSIRDEFSIPVVRLDYLNHFDRNEFKVSASETLKNKRQQALRMDVSFSPEGKIFPRWSGALAASAPVYGHPIEILLGGRYSYFDHATASLFYPGVDIYLPASFVFSPRILGSKVTANTVQESKWLLGYTLKVARLYGDDNSYAVYFSKNTELTYTPLLLDYELAPVNTLGVTLKHWFNDQIGFQPLLEWQKRSLDGYTNWYTVNLALLFKLK